jgi:hypothetical protein
MTFGAQEFSPRHSHSSRTTPRHIGNCWIAPVSAAMNMEYDVSRNHKVEYPQDVAKKRGDLLRLFNPLLETRHEHQLHFIEEGAEGGSTAAPAS